MCMPNRVIILLSTVLTVLACKWTESRTKPECLVENRFSFNYRVTDHLTLEIPDATEEIAGKYACALVPSDHRTVQMCNLTVKGKIFPPSRLLTIQRRSTLSHKLNQTSFILSLLLCQPPPHPPHPHPPPPPRFHSAL